MNFFIPYLETVASNGTESCIQST